MLGILRAYDVPDIIVSAIGILYIDTEIQVLVEDEETAFFKIRICVRP